MTAAEIREAFRALPLVEPFTFCWTCKGSGKQSAIARQAMTHVAFMCFHCCGTGKQDGNHAARRELGESIRTSRLHAGRNQLDYARHLAIPVALLREWEQGNFKYG